MVTVVTFGEAMLRYSDEIGKQIASIGGSELNVLVALAQLGRNTRWISSVGSDDAGKRILYEIERLGIDTSHVIQDDNGLTGKYIVNQKRNTVEYLRAESAFSKISSESFEHTLHEAISDSDWLHLTGITPLLGKGPKTVWSTIITWAELDGTKISIDFNHRPALGEWNELWHILEPNLPKLHLLILSTYDLHLKSYGYRFSFANHK